MRGHVGNVLCVLLFMTLDLVVGPEAYSPKMLPLASHWQQLMFALHVILLSTISFLLLCFEFNQLQNRSQKLEETNALAEAVAQKIVQFDLDDLPASCSGNTAVDLLLQVRVSVLAPNKKWSEEMRNSFVRVLPQMGCGCTKAGW